MDTTPQIENGYVKIANELIEELSKLYLSGNEWRVIMVVVRKTYGWNKKTDHISLTQFQKATNLSRPSVVRSLKKLVAKQILVAKQQPFIKEYGLNKHYKEWTSSYTDTSSRFATTPSSYTATTLVAKQQPKLVAIQQHTKDNKDTIQKTLLQKTYTRLKDLDDFVLQEIADKYKVPLPFVRSKLDDMTNWLEAKGKRYKNYKSALMNWVKQDAIKIISSEKRNANKQGIDARNI
jgi:phage replication O-like protein O